MVMTALLSDQQKNAKAKADKAITSFDSNINIDALPAPVRNYIRLQHEITGRDVGQNPHFFQKEKANSFSQADTQKVEKERKKRRQWWYEFLLMQIKLYSQIFAQTWLKIEFAEKQIELMEEQLDKIDGMQGASFSEASSSIRDKINAVKDDLQDYKERLLNKPEPTEASMIKMQEKIDERVETLAQYFKNINSIRKKAQQIIVASSSYSYFSVKNFIERQTDCFRHLNKATYEDEIQTQNVAPFELQIESTVENDNAPEN